MSAASAAASTISIDIAEEVNRLTGESKDLPTLWKVHDNIIKHIRKVEKETRGKPKKQKDPNAPKKTAGPQLIAWNAQVARIKELSTHTKDGALPYNDARAVAVALKSVGKLNVKKDEILLPSDSEVVAAIHAYHHSHKVKSVQIQDTKDETKEVPKKETTTKKKKEPRIEQVQIDSYDYVINNKTYDRIDANGHAYIWDKDGKYMGVYNEKKKKFDTSIPEPESA
jgi:hypothetical protein